MGMAVGHMNLGGNQGNSKVLQNKGRGYFKIFLFNLYFRGQQDKLLWGREEGRRLVCPGTTFLTEKAAVPMKQVNK